MRSSTKARLGKCVQTRQLTPVEAQQKLFEVYFGAQQATRASHLADEPAAILQRLDTLIALIIRQLEGADRREAVEEMNARFLL